MFNVKLNPHEQPCNAKFNNPVFMTRGFNASFEPSSHLLAYYTLQKIIEERVNSEEGADYLQVALYQSKKFWIIDDGRYITFLMPEDIGGKKMIDHKYITKLNGKPYVTYEGLLDAAHKIGLSLYNGCSSIP